MDNKNNEYTEEYTEEFLDEQLYFTEEIYKQYTKEEVFKELNKLEEKHKEKLFNEIGKILLFYTITDSVLTLSNRDKVILTRQCNKIISDYTKEAKQMEKTIVNSVLKKVSVDKFYTNEYIYNDKNIKNIDNNIIKDIINKKIDSKLYSERIYNNRDMVASSLKKELKDLFDGKTNVNKIENKLSTGFNISKYNTRRLVTTEIARVQEATNQYWREQRNIKNVMYCATLDNKTCHDCQQYDGKVYDAKKIPISLPKHSNCRCTYLDIPNTDYRPLTRMDNITKENIDWTTYQEWKKQKNIK